MVDTPKKVEIDFSKPFEAELNDNEAFTKINSVYQKKLEEGTEEIDHYFRFFNQNVDKLKRNLKEFMKIKYKENIANIEEGLKDLSEQKVESNNPLAVKRFKQQVETLSSIVEDEKYINNEFQEIFNALGRKLKIIKLSDLIGEEMKISFTTNIGKVGWEGSENSIMTVLAGGTSYKCYKSTETFTGILTCKLKITELDSSKIEAYWNYSIGLIKSSSTNQSSYYTDAVLLQSNGHCNTQFSGISNTTTKLTNSWKSGDTLIIKRDAQGDVYFGVGDQELIKGFSSITGEMKICVGFSSSCSGEIIEMLEIGEYF